MTAARTIADSDGPWVPAGAPPLLAEFRAAGVLGDADVDVACGLARLAGETDPTVVLAAALAVRAPRVGHVCVELASVADHVVVDADPRGDVDSLDALAWPDPDRWAAAVARSPLSGDGAPPDSPAATPPLVLHDGRCYLDRYWRYERRLVDALRARAGRPVAGVDPAAVRALMGDVGLDGPPDVGLDRQRLAIACAATQQLTVVTGGPGTGKTTTVVHLLALLCQLAGSPEAAPRLALAAPTGKAARRLTESLGAELDALAVPAWVRERLAGAAAVTLHRLLRVNPRNPSRFRHNRANPVPADVVIVDEASMVSLPLMAKLVDAVADDARLVLLGDRDQLASVEAGAVLGDVCGPGQGGGPDGLPRHAREVAERLEAASGLPVTSQAQPATAVGIWDAVVRLTRFHRFAETSGIGRVAHAIRGLGDDPAPAVAAIAEAAERADAGVAWHPPAAASAVADDVVAGYRRVVTHAEAGDVVAALTALAGLRVLCAHREGPASVAWWNQAIAERLAADGVATDERWFVGRPVLIGENDYALELFNGDVGVVVAAPTDDDPQRRVAAFPRTDGTVARLAPSRLPSHDTTFAMTVHKSQGSQFDHAVVVLPEQDSPVCTRELVYTALTRARRTATLLADSDVLAAALGRRIQRPSGLGPALWGDAT